MHKSVSAFIVGFLSSLIGAVFSYLIFLVVGRVSEISGGTSQTMLTIFSFLNMSSFGLAIIGSFFSLGIAKTGGIILFIASGISAICFTTIFISLKVLTILFAPFFFPTLFVFIAGIIAIHSKKS